MCVFAADASLGRWYVLMANRMEKNTMQTHRFNLKSIVETLKKLVSLRCLFWCTYDTRLYVRPRPLKRLHASAAAAAAHATLYVGVLRLSVAPGQRRRARMCVCMGRCCRFVSADDHTAASVKMRSCLSKLDGRQVPARVGFVQRPRAARITRMSGLENSVGTPRSIVAMAVVPTILTGIPGR